MLFTSFSLDYFVTMESFLVVCFEPSFRGSYKKCRLNVFPLGGDANQTFILELTLY